VCAAVSSSHKGRARALMWTLAAGTVEQPSWGQREHNRCVCVCVRERERERVESGMVGGRGKELVVGGGASVQERSEG
jgi:hypothetical protein